MFGDSRRSMANNALRRTPDQPQHETGWQERDLRELPTEAKLAVRSGLTRALAALKPRKGRRPKRAMKRRKASASPPYHLLALPVMP